MLDARVDHREIDTRRLQPCRDRAADRTRTDRQDVQRLEPARFRFRLGQVEVAAAPVVNHDIVRRFCVLAA